MIGTNHFKLLAPVCLSVPAQTTLTCLMIMEAWHRERPGERFNTMAQTSDASHGLWVLNKEVFEFLELSWRGKDETMQQDSCYFKQT